MIGAKDDRDRQLGSFQRISESEIILACFKENEPELSDSEPDDSLLFLLFFRFLSFFLFFSFFRLFLSVDDDEDDDADDGVRFLSDL